MLALLYTFIFTLSTLLLINGTILYYFSLKMYVNHLILLIDSSCKTNSQHMSDYPCYLDIGALPLLLVGYAKYYYQIMSDHIHNYYLCSHC